MTVLAPSPAHGPRSGLKVLVLGLGNDLCGDDAVGLVVAAEVASRCANVDVVRSGEAGLALLELLTGYERAIIVDSICTRRYPVGTVLFLKPESLGRVVAPSAHYAGLPEVLDLGNRLHIPLPKDMIVIAIEVGDPYTIREGLTPHTARAMPRVVDEVLRLLDRW